MVFRKINISTGTREVMFTMKYKTRELKVKEFHKKFNLDIDSQPRESLLSLRSKLILEEANEVSEVLNEMSMNVMRGKHVTNNQTECLLKEVADLQYVLSGTVVALGNIKTDNFDAAINLVHESNMSKLDNDGNVVYDSKGKVLKSNNYKEPDLSQLI